MTASIQPVISWTFSRTGDSAESCVEGTPCKIEDDEAVAAAKGKQPATLKK
jgi:hypothetical protein